MHPEPERRPRDRRFLYDLMPCGALAALADEVVGSVVRWEAAEGLRKRRRRPEDHAAFRRAVGVLVANLAHCTLFASPASSRITMPLSRRPHVGGRVPEGFNRTLRPTLEALEASQVLTLRGPEVPGMASTIEPTGVFAEEVRARGIAAGHFSRDPGSPVVSHAVRDAGGKKHYRTWPETVDAAAIERDVRAINAALACADVDFVGHTVEVDTRDRRLVRHFTDPHWADEPSPLAYGGRLFGGFWQLIRRAERAHIRIAGEPVAEVDFGQAFPRLALAAQGAPEPSGDVYRLRPPRGLSEPPRGAVKRAVACLLFTRGKLRKWPDEVAEDMPPEWTVPRFRRAFVAAHPALRTAIGTGVGHRLMRTESDILVRVLLRCAAAGVTALPLHDAVICAASAGGFVRGVMEEEGEEVSGARLPVSITIRTPA